MCMFNLGVLLSTNGGCYCLSENILDCNHDLRCYASSLGEWKDDKNISIFKCPIVTSKPTIYPTIYPSVIPTQSPTKKPIPPSTSPTTIPTMNPTITSSMCYNLQQRQMQQQIILLQTQ